MKLVRRANLFETNSSSVHALCVSKETYSEKDLPKEVYFELYEYGWEEDTLCSPDEKASYLWTAVCYLYGDYTDEDGTKSIEERRKFIEEALNSHNIHAEFEDPKEYKYFYIDHGSILGKWLEDILSDADKLMRFLFSENSMVITGNDNIYEDDSPAWSNVPNNCDVYMKGN